MLPIAAAVAFLGLFALWVLVPRFFIRRKQNENNTLAAMSHDESGSQPAPSPAD